MPLTDLRTITLPHALRYTSRFGLNRSQGAYFYQVVRKSPPDTYLADLRHVSQPSSTSLLGRLLREACGTLPQLIPQEQARDNTQSRRAWYNFEMKYGPSRLAEQPREASLPCAIVLSDQKVVAEPVQPLAESPASDDLDVITVRRPTSPPPAIQPSLATSSAQPPLSTPIAEIPPWGVDTYQYPHIYGITNAQSSHTLSQDDINLHSQFLHYYNSETPTYSESIQQDDMDCLPPSPFSSSDIDMDILTDTEPAPPSYDHLPWTQWIPTPDYVAVQPLQYSAFIAPQPVSIWQTPVQGPPPSVNHYSSGFVPPTQTCVPSLHADTHSHWDVVINGLPGNTFASAASELPMEVHNPDLLPTYHPGCLGPIDVTCDRTQDTLEMHWQEPLHGACDLDSTSVVTLLDDFERSLTLVANEMPPSESENRSDHNCHSEPMPACVTQDERISLEPIVTPPSETNASDVPLVMLDSTCSNGHPDHSVPSSNSVLREGENSQDKSSPFERESTEPLEEGDYFPNLQGSPPPPFERETTEPLEDGQDQPPVDTPPPWIERKATELLEQGEDQPPSYVLDRPRRPLDPVSLPTDTTFEAPVAHPRPPTPPPPRRTKPTTSHDTSANRRTTRQSIARLVATARAVLDAKRLATNTNQDRIDLAQASVQASKRAQLQAQLGGARVLRPLLPRCGMGRREEEEGEERGDEIRPTSGRRDRKKRTRFVMPYADDDEEEDIVARPLARPRRVRGSSKPLDMATSASASSTSTRRATTTGPPRSILRNARATAMPYQKAVLRHVGRRASVP